MATILQILGVIFLILIALAFCGYVWAMYQGKKLGEKMVEDAYRDASKSD